MDNILVNIPEVANYSLPDPSLLNLYKDRKERIIWLDDEINDFSLDIIKFITHCNIEDRKKKVEKRVPIKLLIFSPGGDLDVNNAIINAIEASKTPIYGINMGRCCSAAAYIFLACHKRYMMKDAYFLYHTGSGQLCGTYEQVFAQMEEYKIKIENLIGYMKSHTKFTEEEIMDKIGGEWYIYNKEAIEKGVAHKVINSLDEIF